MNQTANELMNIIHWAHRLLAEVIEEGDVAIDLTAGRGHDTLWLAQQVEAMAHGHVIAFDVQQAAIDSTTKRLSKADYTIHTVSQQLNSTAGITLYHGCHSRLVELTDTTLQVKAVIANFGYLPNGDHTTTTQAKSSCAAILHASQLLAPHGRIALVLYTGHSGATAEVEAIEKLCEQLEVKEWNIIRIQPVNRNNAPYLLILEKR